MDLNAILKTAVERGASDVHIKPGLPPVFVDKDRLLRLLRR